MKPFLIFCVFMISCSAAASDSFNARTDRVLQESGTDIAVIGMLQYCGKQGLATPVYQKISDAIVSHSKAHVQAGTGSDEVALLRVADTEANGIAIGLRIAELDAAGRRRICDSAVNMVDQMLGKRLQGSSP